MAKGVFLGKIYSPLNFIQQVRPYLQCALPCVAFVPFSPDLEKGVAKLFIVCIFLKYVADKQSEIGYYHWHGILNSSIKSYNCLKHLNMV